MTFWGPIRNFLHDWYFKQCIYLTNIFNWFLCFIARTKRKLLASRFPILSVFSQILVDFQWKQNSWFLHNHKLLSSHNWDSRNRIWFWELTTISFRIILFKPRKTWEIGISRKTWFWFAVKIYQNLAKITRNEKPTK